MATSTDERVNHVKLEKPTTGHSLEWALVRAAEEMGLHVDIVDEFHTDFNLGSTPEHKDRKYQSTKIHIMKGRLFWKREIARVIMDKEKTIDEFTLGIYDDTMHVQKYLEVVYRMLKKD